MAAISASVGQGGVNKPADVLLIQKILNKHVRSLGLKRLKEDGLIGINTVGAIRKYQADIMRVRRPDGRVDVDGLTLLSLNAKRGLSPGQEAGALGAPPASAAARWTWDQSAGALAWDGRIIAYGYAGKGRGKNNPDLQHVQRTGPIPRGLWRMTHKYKSPNTGRDTIILEPESGTDTLGRSLFRIHGDNATHTASEGCIILAPHHRLRMWASRSEAPLIEVVR